LCDDFFRTLKYVVPFRARLVVSWGYN